MIQRMLAILSLVPLPFLKPAWTSGISQFTYCWGLAWKFLSITLLACAAAAAAKSLQSCPTLCDDECSCVVVWTFFGIAFLWDWNENWPLPVAFYCCCCCCCISSVMSDSVRPHRQQPTRLPCPWDSPGKNTGVGCHFLLWNIEWASENYHQGAVGVWVYLWVENY